VEFQANRAAAGAHPRQTHVSRALDIHREVGNRRSESITLGNLGATNHIAGQTDEALEQFNRGWVALLASEPATAREALNKAESITNTLDPASSSALIRVIETLRTSLSKNALED
jgi:hypothetical protein